MALPSMLGFTVVTTGGVYIELPGDLIEDGTGYLKGVVKNLYMVLLNTLIKSS